MLEKVFKLKEKGTDVKTEIIAGITTFLAMAYILFVNPSILSETGMSFDGVFFATAIASAFASIMMGVLANYPVALSAGMGVNAFFAYTVVLGLGYSYEAALAAVFVSGMIFILISVTNLRKMVINSIPKNMKFAIGSGIGFFIAFIGFKNAGIIVSNPATFVSIGSLKDPTVLLAIIGLFITIALLTRKVPAAVFWGLVATSIIGVIMNFMGLGEGLPALPTNIIAVEFDTSLVGSFSKGFGELFSSPVSAAVIIFSFLFVDFFDTAGTLVAVGNDIGLVNEDGELVDVEKALLSDSVGTVVGAFLGTSTITSFVESGSGVAAGGRTGLTAVTTGVLFIFSIFFSPLLSVVTNAVTAPALIVVGILMAQQLKEIEWNDIAVATPAFITIIVMILGYSISDGIATGFLFYTITMLASNRHKEIQPVVYILDLIFLLYFFTK
ncbi:MAG: NCS2 family permease [Erysipelotrichaceae bacterium]|nr:NCS2 family permease [Erysipelotrichaceae bacterium]